MTEWIVCPACRLKHRRRSDGMCPRCRRSVDLPATPPPTLPTVEPTDRSYCEACGAKAPTRYTELHQNIGIFVVRLHRSVKGHLCRRCIDKYFRELTLVTFFAGWWGIISFFATPIILISNIIQYMGSRSLEETPLGVGGPQASYAGAAITPQTTAAAHGGVHAYGGQPAGPRRQGLAVAALVFGLISIPTFGLLGIAPLAAIVLGVIALVKAKRRPQEYGGNVMAIAGIALGFVSAVAIGALIFVLSGLSEESSKTSEPGKLNFESANTRINVFDNKSAFGNTAEAEKVAESFARLMKTMSSIAFTGGREEEAPSMTKDHFLTYAELRRDSVCFLVHVPQLKNYQGEARDALLKLSWICAKQATEELRKKRNLKLGVGLRGVFLYGGIAIGMGHDEDPEISEAAAEVDRKKLYAFFTDPAVENAPTSPTSRTGTDIPQ